MKFFDLHCDTITECEKKNVPLLNNDLNVSINRTSSFEKWIQCFAIWNSDDLRDGKAKEHFNRCYNRFVAEIYKNNTVISQIKYRNDLLQNINGAILTVEGASVLGNSLEGLKDLYSKGVRIITLTWNGENEFAYGQGTGSKKGLKPLGKELVERMNVMDITVDVSHLNDSGFCDVAERSQKPIMASHSNSREICCNKRNLTNEQFEYIAGTGGLVGINFHRAFIDEHGNPTPDNLLRHVYKFLSLGGEDAIAIGSDFDGADMPEYLHDISCIERLYDIFLKNGFSQFTVDNIFFNNAYRFLSAVLPEEKED